MSPAAGLANFEKWLQFHLPVGGWSFFLFLSPSSLSLRLHPWMAPNGFSPRKKKLLSSSLSFFCVSCGGFQSFLLLRPPPFQTKPKRGISLLVSVSPLRTGANSASSSFSSSSGVESSKPTRGGGFAPLAEWNFHWGRFSLSPKRLRLFSYFSRKGFFPLLNCQVH